MNRISDAPKEASASTSAPDLGIPYESCLLERILEPCTLVVVGASGDLTARKLIPAVYGLYLNKALPEDFTVLGCARTRMDDFSFRERMRTAVAHAGAPADEASWEGFARRLFYRVVDYEDLLSFSRLAQDPTISGRKPAAEGNRIFYLAIPPDLYHSTVTMIGESRISEESGAEWVRIVVEKPFGWDLESASSLDRLLHSYFREHQIFRIDHYLAKETVQNILMFRFANSIFEPLWDRRYIESVTVTAAETVGVEHRAGYYDRAGVLRDMFQNHMMQLLALTAMDPPSVFEADSVRDEKARVYRSLRPFPVDRIDEHLVLGQYTAGIIKGERVRAYQDEPGVRPGSLTPTYAHMQVFLDNWRWQGVPFHLVSGKRLARNLTEISIQFQAVPHSMFRTTLDSRITANSLSLTIHPEEKITLTFQTKNPGAKVCLRTVTMDFNYHQGYTGPVLEAYQKVLLDCMLGDQMLFWRQDGVELCWGFLTPILEQCETCGSGPGLLRFYESGSWGPSSGG